MPTAIGEMQQLDLLHAAGICAHCGTSEPGHNAVQTASGVHICLGCSENHYASCGHCDGLVLHTTLIPTRPGDDVCWACHLEHFIECDRCNQNVLRANVVEVGGGDEVCEDCRDEHYIACDRCEDIVLVTDTTTTSTRDEVCDDCRVSHYTSCDRCDDYVEDEDITQTVRGSDICPSCLRNWYWQCTHCDGWNRDGNNCGEGCDDRYGDDEDCDCCSCCECSCGRRGDADLHDYYYKPNPEFHGTGPLFLGPEIEIEVGSDGNMGDCVSYASERLGNLGYLKRDSSIEFGFEMVTHPMSYEYAMQNFPWDMLSKLSEMGCYTDSGSNGLHVHVSREAFSSPCHTYRWMKFVYRNERDVIKLARRRSGQWASFDDTHRANVKHYAKGAKGGQRYQAINPTNDATFELRMFASSLKPEEVQAAFGFAHASVEYTRHLTSYDISKSGGWTWDAFAQWVADRPEYASLSAQINR